jgi:TolB-like protein
MAEERTQRHLAAILAADVVGYSSLMEANEAGTLARFSALRTKILDPKFVQFKGRVVGTAGDSLLVEFASAVDAVQCAVEAQARLAERNADEPEDQRIVFRMGVNLGDIIAEGTTIHGDGVNVAARLERLAEPGSVVVARSIHDLVKGKLPFAFTDLGDHTVKNIAEPVRAFRVENRPEAKAVRKQGPTLPTEPSIAVLPFTNISGDPEQQYFSDGVTEDIITELSRRQSLFVIARNSSFQYRDKAMDVRRIGQELGVAYVVEGSVRKAGNRIRVTAQLVEAATGNHIWSERYDRSIDELFVVQDEVTLTIVATLIGQVEDAEIKGSIRKHPQSLAAYDSLLRGIEHLRAYGDDENRRARELFENAISLDPRFALAHAYFALALLLEHGFDSATDEIKERALNSARTAVRLDTREGRCHQFLGQVYLLRGEYDLALSHFERTFALNPNDANATAHRGYALAIVGCAEEGIELIRRAMYLNPLHPGWYWDNLAIAQYTARQYEEALSSYRQGAGQTAYWGIARIAACDAQLGRLSEARQCAAEVLRLKPDFHFLSLTLHHKNSADAEHWLEGFRKAGLPE